MTDYLLTKYGKRDCLEQMLKANKPRKARRQIRRQLQITNAQIRVLEALAKIVNIHVEV